jgi:hypothetical protein
MEPMIVKNDSVWAGLGLTLVFHVVFGMLAGFLSTITNGSFAVVFIFPGLTQLVYIVPAYLYFQRQGRPGVAKGLVIGAAITFLLNAACYGLILGASFGR